MKKLTLLALTLIVCVANAAQPLSRTKANSLLEKIWMRDPYIYLHNDDNYYMVFTAGKEKLKLMTSSDLVSWKIVSEDYTLKQLPYYNELKEVASSKNLVPMLWAPEIYFIDGKWYMVHATNSVQSTIVCSSTPDFKETKVPFTEAFGRHHDPSIFIDDDGSKWLVERCAVVTKLKDDMSGLEGKGFSIVPSDRKMGHEGSQIIKVGGKYVWFGTAWSSDTMRDGTYNLYYATSDKLTGPYSERKFAGCCLGHGTVFKDKEGMWWCAAFRNGSATLSGNNKALSINKGGLTLVPMSIEVKDGDVVVEALDPVYAEEN